MTAVDDVAVRRAAASPAALLAIPSIATFVVVLVVLVLLVPAWLAVLLAVVAGGSVAWWAWARATEIVRSLGGGVPADPDRHARLINVVDGTCLTVGVQRPRVEVVDDPAANALVAGRNERDAVLLVTSGLLDATDRVELEAVIARQLVQLRDPGLAAATLTVTTAALPVLLADRLVRRGVGLGASLMGTATALSGLRRLGVGDDRQTWADLDGVALTRYPPGLIGALQACERVGTVLHAGTRATAHLWMATPIAVDGDDVSVDAAVGVDRRLLERNRAFVGPRALAERIDVLREL